jgi:ABC-type Fe3+-hydroxamate transport system substrate-binding protein
MDKYSRNISCPMSNHNLTFLAIFGVLLLVAAAVSSSLLLMPAAKIVSATTTPSGANETDSSNNMTGATFLFIQSAQSGSLSEVNATTSTLELNDVSNKTIMFSDRPDRIVSATNTTDFIGNWSIGTNSFDIDPPNAVLVLDDEQQKQELAVIELFNPVYDSEANTLRYDIVSENGTSIDGLPGEFGQYTLVIDNAGGDSNTATTEGDSNTATTEGDSNTATARGN